MSLGDGRGGAAPWVVLVVAVERWTSSTVSHFFSLPAHFEKRVRGEKEKGCAESNDLGTVDWEETPGAHKRK